MKNFLIWSFTTVMSVIAGATYWYPELSNLVAAYSILMILLGIFGSGALTLSVWAYGYTDDVEAKTKMRTALESVKSIHNNPIKRWISYTSKIILVSALIYTGWVFTAVLFGLVNVCVVYTFKSINEMDLGEDL